MRYLPTMLVILALGIGMAYAQVVTVVTTPAAPVMTTATTPLVCTTPALDLATRCPSVLTQNITGEPVLLVLGSEQEFVLENIPAIDDVSWRHVPVAYSSIFAQGNPLTYTRVNNAVVRHGNPYYPYFQIGPTAAVAGLEERLIVQQPALPADAASVLSSVRARYQGLTPAQAMALGYVPVGGFMAGTGQVYVNQALVDNCFDPMLPEAFVFNQQGNIVAVQYHVIAAQPVSLFGQALQPSTLVQGGQQLNVWLFSSNPSGMFAMTNPNLR